MADATTRPLLVFASTAATPVQFVECWSGYYPAEEDKPYEEHVRRSPSDPAYTEDAALALFRWKVGKWLWEKSRDGIKRNFVYHRERARLLPPDISAPDFLTEFGEGGAVWRIFWLHCCYPDRFPIYDQHVHRAMTFIEDGKREELTGHSDRMKVDFYLTRYLPFHRRFDGIEGRRADRALWVFGKFLKKWETFPTLSDAPS